MYVVIPMYMFISPQGVGTENVPWRITKSNLDYGLCETYAPILGVPLTTTDDDLKAVAQFRSKGRIPVSIVFPPVQSNSW